MKDAEKSLDKLLAGLRECEPSAGFEGRVLRGARERAGGGQRVRFAQWTASFAWAAIAVVLVRAGLLMGLLPFPSKAPVHESARSRLSDARTLAVSPVQLASTSAYLPVMARLPQRKNPTRRNVQQVSYPAPPLPLTEQEKLLLQIAHKRAPQAIGPLTAEVQIAQAAREKEEFKMFFNQQDGETNQ